FRTESASGTLGHSFTCHAMRCILTPLIRWPNSPYHYTGNAIETVESIAHLLSYHAQSCKIIGASFKNTKQVIECLSVRQSSVTIPVELAHKMMENPCVNDAINKFHQDWVDCYGSLSH
ncbi:hypothetical protein KW426_20345, partial [Vibrio fluvialis]|nr:hypothetical protein [Vibrio fluvialis]MBY7775473.1 hypothetical protein [Vibrio fluvialis]MBY7779776.1 hypothetical protein [Vibrio fluvialis]MBY7989083.1 hypothetical protein [Vibrio fluvialis]MBY7993359.1 hypothetical protein [Vibrio fluvialis]